MNYTASIVVVGTGPQGTSRIGSTEGTGVLVNYQNELYLVSCRHVIELALQQDALKIITVKGTIDLGYPNPRYCELDSDTQTADFAVIPLGRATGHSLLFIAYGGKRSLPMLTSRMPVEIFGYPTDLITPAQPPKCQLAKVDGHGFIADLMTEPPRERQRRILHQYARITTDRQLAGMSGGLVLLTVNGRQIPFGILTSYSLGHAGGKQMVLAQFVSFAHIFNA